MSEVSRQLLKTTHKGVHEQLDLLAAAMQVHLVSSAPIFANDLQTKSPKELEKWFRDQLEVSMSRLGYNPGFFMRRVLLQVYGLYEPFWFVYANEAMRHMPNSPAPDIQYTLLMLAAEYLDDQFAKKGLADICAFLKQNPIAAIEASKLAR